MHVKPIMYVIDIVDLVVAYILSFALTSGIFPDLMQIAKVTVIYKGGGADGLCNYRPVYILPIVSRGLEKITHLRLRNFADKHAVLLVSQHGFLKNRSTEMALKKRKEVIINGFVQRLLALGVFVDITKRICSY